nr:MAG TPA: PD-(D/E)XK nuclease superfamily protein [Caudoviricetes sp.]
MRQLYHSWCMFLLLSFLQKHHPYKPHYQDR